MTVYVCLFLQSLADVDVSTIKIEPKALIKRPPAAAQQQQQRGDGQQQQRRHKSHKVGWEIQAATEVATAVCGVWGVH
jgi:hypothetical protein